MKSKEEGIEKALANRDKKVFSDGYHLGYENGHKDERSKFIKDHNDQSVKLADAYMKADKLESENNKQQKRINELSLIVMRHNRRWGKLHEMIKVELAESQKSKEPSNCSLLLMGIDMKMLELSSGSKKRKKI